MANGRAILKTHVHTLPCSVSLCKNILLLHIRTRPNIVLPEIKSAYLEGRLILLLGAGASYGSQDVNFVDLPMGPALAAELAALNKWTYNNEPLGSVYSAFNAKNSARLHEFLKDRLTSTTPSDDLKKIANYPWPRIYTLNIDDCMEGALRSSKKQILRIFARNSPLENMDPVFSKVQLIKLNGTADRPEDGFIFSPQEYGDGSSRLPIWYRELGQNYSDFVFVFIGSSLNEPLFQHAIAEMRSTVKRSPIRGYVITPSATEIETYHLDSLNLQHVPGTLTDFARWLDSEIPIPPTTWELATARRPELRTIGDKLSDCQQRALNSITVVSPTTLPLSEKAASGTIRDFYRGYKPSWGDIVDEVPAPLESFGSFSEMVLKSHQGKTCIALVGPAGSGKTTALMTTALYLGRSSRLPVYFLRDSVSDIKNVIISLEQINIGGFYLFIDKIDPMARDVYEAISGSGTKNICIVFSERQNIWNRRAKAALKIITPLVHVLGHVTKPDANAILDKLQVFGPWTRLEAMTPAKRQAELFQKADRQLLIGMLEATTGLGFIQIIRNDFSNLGSTAHQQFLVLVGLASTHRSSLSAQIVRSSLLNLGIAEDIDVMTEETEGIIVSNDKRFCARHPVYVRELFGKITSPEMVRDCLVALLEAFSDYKTPVVKHVGKVDGIVFKSVINHRFVREVLRGDETLSLSVYKNFETKFHVDGLYWLQYGLSLRGFGRNADAFDKLRTARSAYHSPQIEHAYAQQLLILASQAGAWEDAEPMLAEAIEVLKKLESGADRHDTYPIVTLAEGHISVSLKFFGVTGTKSVAQKYANELLVASKRASSPRLEAAVEKIVGLAERGTWSEAYGPDPEEISL